MSKMRLNGTQLINARLDRGWSQAKLALRINVSIPTVCRAEKSETIHPKTAQAICDELDLSLPATRIPVGPAESSPPTPTGSIIEAPLPLDQIAEAELKALCASALTQAPDRKALCASALTQAPDRKAKK